VAKQDVATILSSVSYVLRSTVDRNFKGTFCPVAWGACLLAHPRVPHAAAPPEQPAARCSAAKSSLDMLRRMDEREASRVVWSASRGKGGCGRLRGQIASGMSKAQRRAAPLRGAHVADETTCHVVCVALQRPFLRTCFVTQRVTAYVKTMFAWRLRLESRDSP